MQIINFPQGSQEWLDSRAARFTASEAPAMKGVSKKKKRDGLLMEKFTGEAPEVSQWAIDNLFAEGHRVEALARPLAEKEIGEELYPVTGFIAVDGMEILASFDGLTMSQIIGWECKLWNAEKAADVLSGKIPDDDYWQVKQQLVVSGAEKILYTVTDGRPEKTVHVWVTLNDKDEQDLISGWNQFREDLAVYVIPEVKAKGVASAIMDLPALKIEINGEVKSSNLAIYQQSAEKFISSINTDLKTDNDFATAENAVKVCDKTEKKLDQVKEQALEQTADISELFKTIDFLKAQIREKRLLCTNAIKVKKSEIKMSIATAAKNEFVEFQTQANENLGGNYVFVGTDFNAAMKGKKTIESLQSAANDEVANGKIKVSELAQKVQTNLEMIHGDWDFLFADKAQIVTKENDDFQLLVNARIEAHKAEEKRKADEVAAQEKIDAETEKENLDVESDDKTLDIEDGIVEKSGGEKMSGYPVDETVQATIKKLDPDAWKVVAKSLQENGIGLKSANKIARLIVDGKIDYVMYAGVVVHAE